MRESEPQREAGPDRDSDRGLYSISVTAQLVGTGIQNLRLYERKGLLEPSRSPGGTRLYSADDVVRLTRIIKLLADGLNLAGVAMVLDLQDDNRRLRRSAAQRRRPQQPELPAADPDQ